MTAYSLDATLLEVAKVYLREAFICAQPTLSRVIKAALVSKFGVVDWHSKFIRYIGPSVQAFAIDDGRAFDM